MNWTCEGFKLCSFLQFPERSACVNWTCEGLKRVLFFAGFLFKNRVNWTCEGLKHFFFRGLSINSKVWIEPVRDWNAKNYKTAKLSHKSVNWTCEGLKQFIINLAKKLNQKCELNLWGIETSTTSFFILPPTCVWIEPVRDWNDFSDKISNPFPLLCELNLWGIGWGLVLGWKAINGIPHFCSLPQGERRIKRMERF